MDNSINEQDKCELFNYLTFPSESLATNHIIDHTGATIHQNIIIKPLHEQLINNQIQTQYIIIQQPDDIDANTAYITESEVIETQNVVTIEQETKPRRSNSKIHSNSIKNTANSSIKCSLCDKTFKKLTQYRLHMQEHRNMKKFKCEMCFESYNVESNFKIHMAMHSKGDPRCPICDRKFQRQASLKSHLLLHQVDETFTCTECLAEFEKEEELNSHLETHQKESVEVKSSDVPLTCSFCNYLFYESEKYQEHLILHLRAKRMVLSTKKTRRKHFNVNHKTLPFKCDYCPKAFTKFCLLDRHRRIHTGEKPFICHICNRGFSQNGTLQIHLNKHTGKRPFECIFCSAKFAQKGNLRVHLEKTHTAGAPGEKMFKCNHCPCIFKRVSSLNGHITKCHSNNTQQDNNINIADIIDQLKELDKQTKPMNAIEKKIEVQTMSNVSDTFETSFDTYVKVADSSIDGVVRRYLIKQRKYGDNKWYVCSHCYKEFKKPSDLIRHIRIHTNEKPFKCTECGQKFTQKSTLLNHRKTHSKTIFKCMYCSKILASERTLKRHLKLHELDKNSNSSHATFSSKSNEILSELTKENKIHNFNIIMKQPIIETENGLYSVPAPRPKVPYATLEQYKNRPFKCNICNAAFLKSVHLKRHMQTHIGVKNFECELCQKSFFTQYALKEHMTYHTKIKNHACKTCGKRFYTKNLLKRHMPRHNVTKPYICPYCKKRFKMEQLCRKHMRRHKLEIQNSILALSETGELKDVESDKIMEMFDGNIMIELQDSLTPIETYNNISTMESKLLSNKVEDDIQTDAIVIQNGDKQENINLVDKEKEELILNNISLEDNNTNSLQYPMFITTEELQILNNSNIVNALLPQLKMQNTDPLLLSSINELQESNILYPLDVPMNGDEQTFHNDQQTYDTFNSNIIFNQNINELNLNAHTLEQLQKESVVNQEQQQHEQNEMELNKIDETQRNAINEQLIILNAQKSNDLNLFNMNFPQNDFIDINTLNLNESCKIMETNDVPTSPVNLLCKICKFKFGTVNEFSKHVCKTTNTSTLIDNTQVNKSNNQPNEDEDSFTCQYCNRKFETRCSMLRHTSAKHKETVDNKCKFCGKEFKKRSDCMRHLRTHTGEKPFSCDKCDKNFTLKSTLMSHLRTHNSIPNEAYKCHVCGTYLSCKSSLKKHTQIHTDLKPFKCDLCPSIFRTLHHKRSHMQKHENEKIRGVTAKPNKLNLLQSILLETNENEMFNEEFPKDDIIYQNEDHIELEQATQNLLTSELPIDESIELNENVQVVPLLLQLPSNATLKFQLSVDGQIINVKQDDDALNTNLEEKNFEIVETQTKNTKVQCDICLKFYVSKNVLNKHKRLVHGKHKCEKCNKAFDTKELLDKHSRLHYGFRPYLCPYCANSFAEEASLKVHMKRLHKNII